MVLQGDRGIRQPPLDPLHSTEGDGTDRLLAQRDDQIDHPINLRDAASLGLLDLAPELSEHLQRHRMRLGWTKPSGLNPRAGAESKLRNVARHLASRGVIQAEEQELNRTPHGAKISGNPDKFEPDESARIRTNPDELMKLQANTAGPRTAQQSRVRPDRLLFSPEPFRHEDPPGAPVTLRHSTAETPPELKTARLRPDADPDRTARAAARLALSEAASRGSARALVRAAREVIRTKREDEHAIDARLMLARGLLRLGRSRAASRAIARIDRRHLPDEHRLEYRRLARQLRAHRKLRAQRRALRSLTTKVERAIDARSELAPTLAHQLLQKIERAAPGDSKLRRLGQLLLGRALLASGRPQAAIEAVNRALQRASMEVQRQGRLLKAQALLHLGRTGSSLKLLTQIASHHPDHALGKAAASAKDAIQSALIRIVERKAASELQTLQLAAERMLPQEALSLLNPLTALKTLSGHYENVLIVHREKIGRLQALQTGAAQLGALMRRRGLSLAQVRKMSSKALREHVGLRAAVSIRAVVHHRDISMIAAGHVDRRRLSWESGQPYEGTQHLMRESDRIAAGLHEHVRYARSFYKRLTKDRVTPLALRALAGATDAALSAMVRAGIQTKLALGTATDFYQRRSDRSTWATVASKAVRAGAAMASPITAAGALVDAQSTIEGKRRALVDAAALIAGAGVLRGGGVAAMEAKACSGAVVRAAAQRSARWQRGLQVANAAGGKLAHLDARFQKSLFARTADRLGRPLSNLEAGFQRSALAKGLGRLDREVIGLRLKLDVSPKVPPASTYEPSRQLDTWPQRPSVREAPRPPRTQTRPLDLDAPSRSATAVDPFQESVQLLDYTIDRYFELGRRGGLFGG